jgi:hypothetical protein
MFICKKLKTLETTIPPSRHYHPSCRNKRAKKERVNKFVRLLIAINYGEYSAEPFNWLEGGNRKWEIEVFVFRTSVIYKYNISYVQIPVLVVVAKQLCSSKSLSSCALLSLPMTIIMRIRSRVLRPQLPPQLAATSQSRIAELHAYKSDRSSHAVSKNSYAAHYPVLQYLEHQSWKAKESRVP